MASITTAAAGRPAPSSLASTFQRNRQRRASRFSASASEMRRPHIEQGEQRPVAPIRSRAPRRHLGRLQQRGCICDRERFWARCAAAWAWTARDFGIVQNPGTVKPVEEITQGRYGLARLWRRRPRRAPCQPGPEIASPASARSRSRTGGLDGRRRSPGRRSGRRHRRYGMEENCRSIVSQSASAVAQRPDRRRRQGENCLVLPDRSGGKVQPCAQLPFDHPAQESDQLGPLAVMDISGRGCRRRPGPRACGS